MKLFFWLLATGSWLLASVDGTVVNVTTGKPQAGVTVTLVKPSEQGMQDLGSAKSDAEGKFKFDSPVQAPALLQAIYKDASYTVVLQPGMSTSGVQLKVYDSTSKAGVAQVTQHMILVEPSEKSLDIAETFLLRNESTTTFLDPVKGSVQFYLPEAAGGKAQVTVNAPGGMPIERSAEKTAVKNVYKVAYPIKPGESRFDISYSLPPSETFSSKIMHSEGLTRLVTPSTVTLAGTGVAELGQEPQTKAHIYNATGAEYSVKIAGTGSLRNQQAAAPGPDEDPGEPQIEEKAARVYSRMEWVMGFAFAILGLGGVLLYRKSTA
ncbi:MAG TPA: hypothetical protein VMT15_04770 [Bryobacteraceae bacterium]|nr:hypothetical protein [Bryobacteraceae bacterium]